MATIKKGIMGALSGSVGPVVGATWKNIPYVRIKATQQGKKRTASPAQLANQQKFKFMNAWLEPFHPYVTIGFANLSAGRTELNTAFKINYHEALETTANGLAINYERVCLSRGNLSGLILALVERIQPNTIVLNWNQQGGITAYNDQLMLVVYSPVLKLADGCIGLAKRSDGKLDFTFNPKLGGQSLELYLSMVSLNRKRVSNSQYLGRMEP